MGGVVIIVALIWPAGCAGPSGIRTEVDRTEAQAAASRPIATEVAPASIPFDPALPIWVVTVEPFMMGASGVTSGTGWSGGLTIVAPGAIHPITPPTGMPITNPGEQIGPGMAAQLVSALQRVGNVAVIDYAAFVLNPGKIADGLKEGEQGPFIIKGAVTEFSETADVSGQGESQGPNLGLALIPYVGGIAAYAHGTRSASETKRLGMVGLDVQIIDPSTGRLLDSFTAEGSFTAIGTTKVRTKWGKTETKTDYASSAIGQAQRIALNKTITQIHATFARQALLAKRQ
ncbi:MAG: hypothetical protein HYT21_03255 [Candidatus Nealsonbacteria bacterium]|nr:hypothetical protein [Candidatus Nealsonbacteria bacterium]